MNHDTKSNQIHENRFDSTCSKVSQRNCSNELIRVTTSHSRLNSVQFYINISNFALFNSEIVPLSTFEYFNSP